MTAILAIQDKKKRVTYVAADSCATTGMTKHNSITSKIIIKDDIVFAVCGSYRIINLVQHNLDIPKQKIGQDISNYVYTNLFETMISCFRNNWTIERDNNVETLSQASMIIVILDKLYRFSGDLSVIEHEQPYLAGGSGVSHLEAVIQALIENTKLPKKEIAQKSIEIASNYVGSVGGEVNIVEHKWDNEEENNKSDNKTDEK